MTEREVAMPDAPAELWLRQLPVKRARLFICNAYEAGELVALTKQAVRDKGAAYWRDLPNCGPKTFQAIGAAVGGFQQRRYDDWTVDPDTGCHDFGEPRGGFRRNG